MDSDIIPQSINELISHICSKHGAVLLEAVVRGSKQKPILEVFIDSESGCSLEDCIAVHRELLADETNEFLQSLQRLDVSTPGASRPLHFPWQYTKHIGKTLTISLSDHSEITGILKQCNQNELMLNIVKKNKRDLEHSATIPFDKIIESIVHLSWK